MILAVLLIYGVLNSQSGEKTPRRFKVGDHVRVKWRGQEGFIIAENNGYYMVSISGGRTVESYQESQLEKAW